MLFAAGFAVHRLHGVFGSEKRLKYSDTENADAQPFDPKRLTYEVFGPAGTVANISYFDADANPRYITGVTLPWTLNLLVGASSVVGSVVAQGDSGEIGCRIVVDDTVKAEKTSNHVNAFTSCVLKSA